MTKTETAKPPAVFVKRTSKAGDVKWVGPLRPARAARVVKAWGQVGWSAEVLAVTPETSAEARAGIWLR